MIVSILFSVLIFSLIIFEKGFVGYGLDILHTLSLTIAYSIPFFGLEASARKFLEQQIDQRRVYTGLISRCFWAALLSSFFWGIAVWFFMRPIDEERLLYVFVPVPFITFFCFNLVISLLILFLIRRKEQYWLGIAAAVVLSISFILVGYGAWMLEKCDGKGCGNEKYLIDRAIREGNPSICKLAGAEIKSPLAFFSVLLPTKLYYSNTIFCYHSLAIRTNNELLCENSGYLKDQCYEEFAEKLMNPLLCEKIDNNYSNGYFRDNCYDSLAQKTKDIGLCNKIYRAYLRDSCKRNIR